MFKTITQHEIDKTENQVNKDIQRYLELSDLEAKISNAKAKLKGRINDKVELSQAIPISTNKSVIFFKDGYIELSKEKRKTIDSNKLKKYKGVYQACLKEKEIKVTYIKRKKKEG